MLDRVLRKAEASDLGVSLDVHWQISGQRVQKFGLVVIERFCSGVVSEPNLRIVQNLFGCLHLCREPDCADSNDTAQFV